MEAEFAEIDISLMSMNQKTEYIRREFYDFAKETYGMASYDYYCRDVFMDHPTLGNSIICDYQGKYWAVGYSFGASGEVTFADRPTWTQVLMTYIPVEPAIEETSELLAELHEGEATLEEAKLDFIIAEPGFGNPRDNHYYPAETLKRDAHVFEGLQMHEVQHDDAQRSTRTWVATITEAGKRFTNSGAPIAQATIHDPNFLERAKNLQKEGLLQKLQNSIVALGVTKPGQIAGKATNVVEKIVKGKYIDFVTQAGAGGHALALYENLGPDWELLTLEQLKQNRPDLVTEREETTMPDDTVLKELQDLQEGLTATHEALRALREDRAKEVQSARKEATRLMVEASKLPQKAQERILAGLGETIPDDYQAQVSGLIEAEKAYLSELTGGTVVVGLGPSQSLSTPVINIISLEEYKKAAREIDLKYGLVRG